MERVTYFKGVIDIFNKKAYIRKWHTEHKSERREYQRKWIEENPEYYKKYRIEYKDKIRERARNKYREQHPPKPVKVSKFDDDYLEKRRAYHREYQRELRKNNPEKVKEARKRRYLKDKTNLNFIIKRKEYANQYKKNKLKTEPKFKLDRNLSNTIRNDLNGNKKNRHCYTLIGYTRDKLIKHLTKLMPEGYSWQDYLEGKLHLDHIVPRSAFNYTKPEHLDFKRCWALKNLRLLPAKENIMKSNHLDKPFQPALKMAII